jgi:hypothetical protein
MAKKKFDGDPMVTMYFDKTFTTPKKESWVRVLKNGWRFEHQGYYSSDRGRIPLSELRSHC